MRSASDTTYNVYAFNAGGAPLDAEHFVNAKAEAYWSLREWLERGALAGLTDEETQAQLAGIRYRHIASGRVEIESKDDAKKRGQSSPDRAEALVLAFARVVPRQQTIVWSAPYAISPL
jgi:phage terminase large subunit